MPSTGSTTSRTPRTDVEPGRVRRRSVGSRRRSACVSGATTPVRVGAWRVGPPCGRWRRAAAAPSVAGVTEAHPTNVYAATKLAQEHILDAWCAATETKLSILRLQNVYGPGQSITNSYTEV